MNRKNIFYIALIFSIFSLNAQSDFRSGYIIKSENDTLLGEIDFRSDKQMSKICTFRENKLATVQVFTPNEIQAYRFTDYKYYISKEINGEKIFLELIFRGRINLYLFKDNISEHFYIEKENEKIIEIEYTEKYVIKNGIEYLNKSNKHTGILLYYLRDAKVLEPEIKSIEKPSYLNLMQLAQRYQNISDFPGNESIFIKQPAKIKVYPEITFGFVNYPKISAKDFGFQTALTGHFLISGIGDKFYFKTGILYTRYGYENQIFENVKIPLMLEYIFPKGVFQPKMAIGTNLMTPSVVFSPGINIKLHKFLFFSLNYELEYRIYPWIETLESGLPKYEISSHYFSAGIFLKF